MKEKIAYECPVQLSDRTGGGHHLVLIVSDVSNVEVQNISRCCWVNCFISQVVWRFHTCE